MAHLPIRKKAVAPAPVTWLPMVLVLSVGIALTIAGQGTWRGPREVTSELWQAAEPGLGSALARVTMHPPQALAPQALAPAAQRALPQVGPLAPVLQLSDLAGQTFDIQGHSWVAASFIPITDFTPVELQPVARVNGFELLANRERGVSALNAHAHAYDRLYVALNANRYAALRWRDVPNH